MPASEPGGPALRRYRGVFRNSTLFLDNPGLIAGAYLEAIPVLNDGAPGSPAVDLPAHELSLEARAHAWIIGQESKPSWP